MKQRALYPRNIVISHVYSSDNKGDAALTSVLISDLKRKFPRAKITILKLESISKEGGFEGAVERPSFMYFVANRHKNPLRKLAYALYMMSTTLLWALWLRAFRRHLYLPAHLRAIATIYEQADLIVPVGGGYIRSRKGFVARFNIPLLLHPLLLGFILGKLTVLYSQSIGPFHNKFEEWMAAYVLKRMTLILLREDISIALLARIGVVHNTARAIDSGFLLEGKGEVNIRGRYKIPPDKLLVGVTVRSWLSGESQVAYEKAVAAALDNLAETADAHIIFIPQVTAVKGDDDRVVSRRVHKLMHFKESATVVNDEPDHHQIKAMYGNLDILLGTRFHSVIFSLTSFVPVLAIEYEHKTSGIMRDLQLENWVVKIEDVTAKMLTKRLHRLIKTQQKYRKHLNRQLPPYILEARQTIDRLEDALAVN